MTEKQVVTPENILIVRFSSFGDVVQSLSIPSKIAKHFPSAKIDFVTRSEYAPLLSGHPAISNIVSFDRKTGIEGLIQLSLELRKNGYTRVYDAHNNFRSLIIRIFVLTLRAFFPSQKLAIKKQKRLKRFLLFNFRINKFQMPFSGQRDLLEPLRIWGISEELPPPPQIFPSSIEFDIPFKNFTVIAASAAHALKRWPLDYWKKLIELSTTTNFILLGGPEDTFLNELVKAAPQRVKNFAGQLSLTQSAYLLTKAERLVSNDTGLLHVGEQLGLKSIALMGPAPFGFPSRSTTKILERNLSCRPCSKHGQGPCVNSEFQKCLRDIKPEEVLSFF